MYLGSYLQKKIFEKNMIVRFKDKISLRRWSFHAAPNQFSKYNE